MSGGGFRRVGVLISGRGSNLQALYHAADRVGGYEIGCVIANRASAAGLAWAQAQGLATACIPHQDFAQKADFEAALQHELVRHNIEVICLAGFMRLLSASFLDRWPGRVLNIHPSLLPSFPGLHPQQQALDAGVSVSGCTVHFVSAEMDAGPIITQEVVPVLPGDDETALSRRILNAEHDLYPKALKAVCKGHVHWDGASDRAAIHQPVLESTVNGS